MTDYNVTIRETSKTLTPKERVQVKDTSDCIALDAATMEGPVLIFPEWYAILDVHNERSDDKDYVTYIIVDKDGQRYKTGSNSFWNAFISISDEMLDYPEEDWGIKVYRLPSKNRQGKDFITCSLV